MMNFMQKFALSYGHNKMQNTLKSALDIDILDKEVKKIPQDDKKYMLYAHIPFCHVFCPYCSFHKYQYSEDLCKEYFKNLRSEIYQMKGAGYEFDSLYVGGGTTLIDEDELLKTLELIKKLFNVKEVSCETDPNHLDPSKLQRFKGIIDRLSVGIQSFDNDILRKVSRLEKFGDRDKLIEKLENAIGVLPIISLDLIFNFPFQKKEQLLSDINTAKSLNPQQITLYPLMKSEVTRENIAKTLGVSNKDNEYEFYKLIRDEFKDYHQNNAWAFSKLDTGLADEYVGSNYEYVGVGSGAFSFLNGKLLINAFNLDEYNSRVKNEQSTVMATCEFDKKQRLQYVFLTQLFDGLVDINKYNTYNNCDIKKDLWFELKSLKMVNAIYEENGTIKPTEFGSYLCVVLMKDFYTGMDKVRAYFKDSATLNRARKVKIIEEKI